MTVKNKNPGKDNNSGRSKQVVGWREWIGLPDLGLPPIKAKIDTGARVSALHAFRIRLFQTGDNPYVEFFVHPVQHRKNPEFRCTAPLLDERYIRSSNGRRELRFVVETNLRIGSMIAPIELTLTNRDEMGFRMLVGRQALRKHFIVDPGRSYCHLATFSTPTDQ